MMIGAPDGFDLPLFHVCERRGVHVGQLGATKTIEHAQYALMILKRDCDLSETLERSNKAAEASRGFLAMTVQEL